MPGLFWYWPSAHARQCGFPLRACTFPTAQAWHDVEPLPGAMVPLGQAVHDVLLFAPSSRPIRPGGQPMHAIFFFLSWYLPAVQPSQLTAFSDVDTRPVRQSVQSVPLAHVPGPQTPQ